MTTYPWPVTKLRWDAPEWHPTIGSTNLHALADPRPGRVVVADHQSAGIGRRDRRWESPPGAGLAVSAVVPAVAPQLMGWLPLVAGLAVTRALAGSRWPVEAVLKWPNDVLVPRDRGQERAKVAGILAQVASTGDVIIGTGINVHHTADQLPVPTATSWRLARGGGPLPEVARAELLTAYLDHLAAGHELLATGQVGPVRDAYRAACASLGSEVVVHLPGGDRVRGLAVEVDDSGALVVDGPGGRSVHHAGDVEHLRGQ